MRATGETFVFEGWQFDRQARLLYQRDATGTWTPVPVGSRAQDILTLLLEQPGTLVSKDAIMEAVWPNTAVEPNNLNVQIAALRRVLDRDRSGASCIQTVPGRGYRFVCPVMRKAADVRAPSVKAFAPRSLEAPRLSLVVLPFNYLGGDPSEDYLADAITEDLTTDLSRLPGVLVIARNSAVTYKGQPIDVRRVGEELAVRYVIEGSVRKVGNSLRANAQLVSAETGVHLWADRFDVQSGGLGAGQDEIVRRLATAMGMEMVQVEAARSARERSTDPDAFDLILQARALTDQPMNLERTAAAQMLYERALQLDPSSAWTMARLANTLLDQRLNRGYWRDGSERARTVKLLADAQAIAPVAEPSLAAAAYLQEVEGRYQEAIATAQRLIEVNPNPHFSYWRVA
jgi:adenylate cyclase